MATNTVSTKKINNVKVCTIPREGEEDKRPIKGYEICCHLYGNIYLVAKKNSGKTTLIWNIINRCAGRDTVIIAFVSTIDNDPNWIMIRKKCEDKGLPFIAHNSLIDSEGNDQLDALIKGWQNGAEEDEPETKSVSTLRCMPLHETKTETKTKRKTPYRAPEYIIILDDLADELKKKSVATLFKKNRHFKCKVIISSQWLNDIKPESLGQMSVVCMLQGFSVEKLEEFHSKMRLSIPVDEFVTLYKDATADKFGFLYIDVDHGKYRKRFNEEYELIQ